MADLIDRAALLAGIEEAVVFSGRQSRNAEIQGANKIIYHIKAAPAVEAERVRHGKWKLIGADKLGRGGNWKCDGRDGCGKLYPYKCDYCPNCGAKMDAKHD